MKTYLLPARFKKIGMIMFIPFCVLCLLLLLGGDIKLISLEWPCISLFTSGWHDFKICSIEMNDPTDEFAMLGLLISLCFIALSREKDEDEMTGLIRMQSFVWSLWAATIIFSFGIIFLYEFTFINFSFVAIFLVFLLYIVKFNIEMLKVRRESK